jgi:hypothetical protein
MKMKLAVLPLAAALLVACGGGGGGGGDEPPKFDPNNAVLINEDLATGDRLVAFDVKSGARMDLDSGSLGNYQGGRMIGSQAIFSRTQSSQGFDDTDLFAIDLRTGVKTQLTQGAGQDTIKGIAGDRVVFERLFEDGNIDVLSVDLSGQLRPLSASGASVDKVAAIIGNRVFVEETLSASGTQVLSTILADGSTSLTNVFSATGLRADFRAVVGDRVIFQVTDNAASPQTSLESSDLDGGNNEVLANVNIVSNGTVITNTFVGALSNGRILFKRNRAPATGAATIEYSTIGTRGAAPLLLNIGSGEQDVHVVDGRIFSLEPDAGGVEQVFEVFEATATKSQLTTTTVSSVFKHGVDSAVIPGGLMILQREFPTTADDVFALPLGSGAQEIPLAVQLGNESFQRLESGHALIARGNELHSVAIDGSSTQRILPAASGSVRFEGRRGDRLIVRQNAATGSSRDLVAVDLDGKNPVVLSGASPSLVD